MLRLAAVFGIILGAWGIGKGKSMEKYALCRRVRAVMDGILSMENEIRALLVPLPVAMEHAGAYDALFGMAAARMEDMDAAAAFRTAAEACAFPKACTEILAAFAAGLTAPDTAGQIQNAALCRTRLGAYLAEAEENKKTAAQLYTRVGALGGAMVAVLLL